MTPELKNRLTLLAKGTVTLILLGVSLRLVRFDLLTDHLRDIRWFPLTVSALLLTLGGFAGAGSWFCILRLRLPSLSFRETAACHWSGMFFNTFLPSNVGGDVVKGYIVARDRGQPGFVVTSLLLDRALNLGLLCCIGLFALLLRLGRTGWAAAFLAALGLLLMGSLVLARRLADRVRHWPRAGLQGRLALLLEPVFDLMAAPRRFAPMLLAALVSQFLKIWHNVFVLQALGLELPDLCVWYVIPLFGLVSALPVSIGGLGLRETVASRIAAQLGSDSTHLVLFSLAGYVMVTLVNMLGVIPFLFARRSGRVGSTD